MKKLIVLLILGSAAVVATAAGQVSSPGQAGLSPEAQTTPRQAIAAFDSGLCAMDLQTHVNADGTTLIDYAAPNKTLHFCQYVREVVAPACVSNRSCQSFEAWSKANADLDPRVPHSLFVSLILERRRIRPRDLGSISN